MSSAAGSAGSGGGTSTRDRVAGIDAMARIADRAAADRDRAVEDQRLEARARQVGDVRGQHAVEPLAGFVRRGNDRSLVVW